MADLHDPSVVMQLLTTEDCIDIVWSVLEGPDSPAQNYAREIAEERSADDAG